MMDPRMIAQHDQWLASISTMAQTIREVMDGFLKEGFKRDEAFELTCWWLQQRPHHDD